MPGRGGRGIGGSPMPTPIPYQPGLPPRSLTGYDIWSAGQKLYGPDAPTGIDGAPDPAGTTPAAINAMDLMIPPPRALNLNTGGAVSPMAGMTMMHRMGDRVPAMLDPDEVVFTPKQLDALRIAKASRPRLLPNQISAIRLAHRT